jgi:hypothetical protein
MRPDFRVHFNGGKQWVDVFISDSPAKFIRRNECHAYYIANTNRKRYYGLFGFVHLKKMDSSPESVELMAHELDHLLADWRESRRIVPTPRNEERLATLRGQIEKTFWRKFQIWSTA